MSTYKYLDDNGLTYYHSKVKTLLNGKQNTLSTAQVNAVNSGITSGKVSTYDGYASTISGKADKATTLSGYGITNAYTKTETDTAISAAVAGITGVSFEVVSSLPATGQDGVIYLVPNSGANPNSYDEYIWLSAQSRFEKIGTTDVDLSGYVQSSEMVTITNAEIDTIVA